MSKLIWITDLHLESCHDRTVNKFLDSIEPGSILIISGDISTSYRLLADLNMISSALRNSEIYFVLGNHDIYGNYINSVRDTLKRFVYMQGHIHYLPDMNRAVPLEVNGDNWSLIGVDGWADAKAGDFFAQPSLIKDYQNIYDFSGMADAEQKRRFLNQLGKEEAYKLWERLELVDADNVLIATHVPPYPEAHVYQGKPASDTYLPHFVCVSTGEVITEYALNHKDKNIHIICGHTHQKYDGKIMDNVTVHVGYANYSELSYVDLNSVLTGKK